MARGATRYAGFALVVVAAGGTGAVAQSKITGDDVKRSTLTGRHIKNSSLTGADVRNRSLEPRDFDGSVRGPRGERGPEGPQGPQGPPGEGMGAELTTVVAPPTTIASGDFGTSLVECPITDRAVSGGYQSDNALTFVAYNRDLGNAELPRIGWSAIAFNASNADIQFSAVAYCGRAGQNVRAKATARARAKILRSAQEQLSDADGLSRQSP